MPDACELYANQINTKGELNEMFQGRNSPIEVSRTVAYLQRPIFLLEEKAKP